MREREQWEIFDGFPITEGREYMDIYYPYGDGPWTLTKTYTVNEPAGGPHYTYRKWCVDETHPGPPYLEGGPLEIFEWFTDQWEVKGSVDVISGFYRYEGMHLPALQPKSYLSYTTFEEVLASGWGDASDFGAAGWNKFRPTRSGAELGVFLGEIHEVPRMLRTTAKGFHDLWRSMGGSLTAFAPKKVANHWLNTQFGWRPFLNDLRQFYKTTLNLRQKVDQLRRDNGRWVRRRGKVDSTTSSEVLASSDSSPGLMPTPASQLFNSPYGNYLLSRSFQQDVWFSGSFRYWIPGKPDSWEWTARALACIYGLYPSPSLVWELTPWSWLIDWCIGMQDVIDNCTSILFDNLCAKYAYVMAKSTQDVEFTGCNNYKSGAVTETWNASMTRKSRAEASPFGFGLTSDDFTARQWSILGALGLSRLF